MRRDTSYCCYLPFVVVVAVVVVAAAAAGDGDGGGSGILFYCPSLLSQLLLPLS